MTTWLTQDVKVTPYMVLSAEVNFLHSVNPYSCIFPVKSDTFGIDNAVLCVVKQRNGDIGRRFQF